MCLLSILGCKKIDKKPKLEQIEKGQKLFTSVGCATCHSLSGKKLYGPSLNTILGTEIKVIRKKVEHTVIIDKNYILQSIIHPDFEKPIEFKNSKMPKPILTTNEINCIVDYIISINKKTN
ncbi:hypothetical protein GCM10022291_18270 [Postechiella marina]|uniref:Cytochrome c domain-containing protein n=2 Tax=Postechiella marina TaxID=943941 RepID=A0ABP8C9B1_9FLAO